MYELLQSITPDNVLAWLKFLGVVAVTVFGYLKRHLVNRRGRALERRYMALKALLEEGVEKLHPLLLETGIAAAMGHSRLSAGAIRLLLRQDSPLQAMDRYLRGTAYVTLARDGSHFEPTLMTRTSSIRKTSAVGAFLLYMVFAMAALWLLMYLMPELLQSGKWAASLLMFVSGASFGAIAFLVLREGVCMQQAYALVRDQKTLYTRC